MNTTLLLAYLGTVLILIATPGPVVALVVGTSGRSGTGAAIRTALGANAASLVLVAAAALILAGSLALSPVVLNAVALVGCVFMACLGLGALRAPAVEDAPPPRASGWWHGFAVGIANPKDILFFVAFFPQFIHVTASFGTSIGVLAALWLVVDLGVLALYIALMRGALAQRHRALVARLSGLVLLLVAVAGAVYSARALLAA
ncbi:LysE family translocator [Pseudomonas qingdaonensis]|uniref:LysE family translocator n=1 Tax=Pseudomonas qingdaonensis TaxID=2056231 RepID=UPI0028A5C703|nr:LysE family translocator [Pseudomonas qingdaonensis]